jgi:hypothetical protein
MVYFQLNNPFVSVLSTIFDKCGQTTWLQHLHAHKVDQTEPHYKHKPPASALDSCCVVIKTDFWYISILMYIFPSYHHRLPTCGGLYHYMLWLQGRQAQQHLTFPAQML